MKYEEETYLLESITNIQEDIRSPTIRQLIVETHENNVMLKQIIKVLNTYIANHNTENNNDFVRNVLANLISSNFELNNIRK